MERGSVYDGLILMHTTDDLLDIHGFWGYIEKTAGRTILIQRDHQMPAESGDRLAFFDRQTGAPAGRAVVEAVTNQTLTLDRDASAFANAIAENPDRQNNGWVIRNSTFTDCYQRLLVQGGNGGTLENCTFTRTGSSVQLHSNFFTKNEGGICRGISILGNTFTGVASHPEGVTIDAGFQSLNHDARTPVLSNLTIRGNTFIRPGRHAISFGLVSGGEISGNIIREPGLPRRLAGWPPHRDGEQPFQIRRCAGITVSDNRLEPGEAPSGIAVAAGLVNVRESSEVIVKP